MTIITEVSFIQVIFFEVRMYKTIFELISKNASRDRQIDNVSDSGK